jgi:uncharacterized damage-inducible protein DinB
MTQAIKTLLFDRDTFFSGENFWQPSLCELIEPLTFEQALWKPSPERHSIWELLRHINFWKEYVIASGHGSELPDTKSGDWSTPPRDASDIRWKEEIARAKLLEKELSVVISEMGEKIFETTDKPANYIRQILCHDTYHTGQIGLLRVMQGIKHQ